MAAPAALPLKRWVVRRTETIEVEARTEDHALYLGRELLAYYGSDQEDMQADELDEFGLTEERNLED